MEVKLAIRPARRVTGDGLPALDGTPVMTHEMNRRVGRDFGDDGSHVLDQHGQGIVRLLVRNARGARTADVVGHHVEPPAGQESRDGGPDGAGVRETVDQEHGGPPAVTQLGHGQVHAAPLNPPLDDSAGGRRHLPGGHGRRCTTGGTGLLLASSPSY